MLGVILLITQKLQSSIFRGTDIKNSPFASSPEMIIKDSLNQVVTKKLIHIQLLSHHRMLLVSCT